MGNSYERQKDTEISNGNVINANDLDSEFNTIENTFNASSGHVHDGTTGNGAPITKVGPSQDLVVSSTSVLPKTTNTLDVGSSGAQFKDGYFDGSVKGHTLQAGTNGYTTIVDNEIDVSSGDLTVDIAGDLTIDVDGGDVLLKDATATWGGLSNNSGNLVVKSGTTTAATFTGANVDLAGTLAVTGQTTLNGGLVMDTDKFVVADTTGNTTIAGTLGVTGLSTLATVDVNGGAIDGTIIGANTAAAITGTTITGTSLVGPLTGNASTATALATARSITIDGDVDASATNFDGTGNITLTTTLDTVNSNVGSFGSATAIPVLTVNGKGLVTAASTAAITTTLTVGADSGLNDAVSLADDTLTFAGTTNEIETTVTNNQIQIGLPNNVTVAGNLTVSGTTTTVNTTNMTVSDKLIELGNGRTGSASGDSGLVIERGDDANAFIGFDESADKFTVGTGTFTGASTGDLTITTGTLVANIEGAVTGNATTATTLATARTIAGQSFNGSANISIAPTDLTGVTSTASDLNILDGSIANTVVNSKAVVYGSSGEVQATTIDLGNWTITESGGVLYFATSAVNKMKLDASGNLTVVGNITAYGTI
jgi:hypothetical protein